jgi:hypothetical protein
MTDQNNAASTRGSREMTPTGGKIVLAGDFGSSVTGTGSSGDGTPNLLVLQQLDVQISLDRPIRFPIWQV